MKRNLEFGLLATGVLVTIAVSTLFYASFSLNHDSSWYLVATRMFLDGGTLYRDIVEINPPLAFYLTAPALLLADFTGLTETTAFFLYVSALGGISVTWVYLMLRRTSIEPAARLLFTACAFVACFLIAVQDFGQREHFMLIFAMPYFTYLFFRDDLPSLGEIEQSALGLFAFFGLGLKPYFLLVPAGIVLASWLRTRRYGEFLNLANVSLGIALVSYLAFILLVHPLYLDEIVPEASLVYGAFRGEPLTVLRQLELIGVIAAVGLAIACHRQLDRPAMAIIGAMIGALASYLIQFKGWNYQIVQVAFFTFLGASWITHCARQSVREHVLLGVTALIAIGFSLCLQVLGRPYTSRTTEAFAPFVERAGTPVLVLSSNVSAAFPFINEVGAQWTSRYPTQWLLPGAISLLATTDCANPSERCGGYRDIVAETRTRMVEDFVKGRPAVVFIDDRPKKSYFGDTPFDYEEFLLADPAFAELWAGYHQMGRAGDYEVWAIADKAGASDND